MNSNTDAIGCINAELEKVRNELKEDMLDLRCRSMRQLTLLWHTGRSRRLWEDDEKVHVRQDARRKEINFKRVHRIGRKSTNQNARPRNIVAKFTHYKDRELARKQDPKMLKGTTYCVQEQFPVETDQRRRALFPVMRGARRRNQRVRLMRDRLFAPCHLATARIANALG